MFALSKVLADRKLLGREPAYWVGLGQAAIALLVTFNLSGLSAEQASLWVAAVIAVGTVLETWTVRATLLAALVGATKAVLVLGIGYGLPITDTQVGLLAALVTVAGSGWLRTQTSPADTVVSDGSTPSIKIAFDERGAVTLHEPAVWIVLALVVLSGLLAIWATSAA